MHRSDYIEGKVTYTVISKMKLKLGWKFLINPSFLRSNFFSKCSKKFSIGYMMMFKVCKRCLQPCSLRQKKNYDRTISTSKYIQKSWPPSSRGGGSKSLLFLVKDIRILSCLRCFIWGFSWKAGSFVQNTNKQYKVLIHCSRWCSSKS